jgi:hypothetical protein
MPHAQPLYTNIGCFTYSAYLRLSIELCICPEKHAHLHVMWGLWTIKDNLKKVSDCVST